MRHASLCACSRASASSASHRARSFAFVWIGTRLTRMPPLVRGHYGQLLAGCLALAPFWSRNRLTFLHNARYQVVLGPNFPPGLDPMDAIMTETNVLYSSGSPMLVAGSNDAAIARAMRTVDAFGIRLADAVPVAAMPERLRRQASASAMW